MNFRFRLLRRFWWLRLRSRCIFWAGWLHERWGEAQCSGRADALMWIPVADAPAHQKPGYFRAGSMQVCQRRAGHTELCRAPIDEYGEQTPDGTNFAPERPYCPRCHLAYGIQTHIRWICEECRWEQPIPRNWPVEATERAA